LKGPRTKAARHKHPEDDPSGGEGLIKAVYEAIRNSPVWDTSLLVIVYDEHGGFYDSVAPGAATPPGDLPPPAQETRNCYGFDFSRYGVRVPAVIVSPFVPKGTVDHTLYDHTSILATVERWLGLRPLTKRDGGANDLRSLLSLPAPRKDCLQTLPAPVRAPKQKKDLEENLLGELLHAIDDVVDEVETVVERVVGDVATLARESLPQSGNVIGFLHILLKTELEISKLKGEGETEEAKILDDFRKIKTKRQAQAYVKRMYDKIEVQRKK
jgi:phospholipase C